jgi:hypothetical protein
MAMGRKKKTTKRKVAHPKLPMQQQLNLRHEGRISICARSLMN